MFGLQATPMTTQDIQLLLPWQPGTTPGQLVAHPTRRDSAFWSLWKTDKEAMRQAGVRVKPDEGGTWVAYWTPVSAQASSERQVAPEPAQVNQTRPNPMSAPTAPLIVAVPVVPASIKFSTEQLAILEWGKLGTGHLIVRARAGTGKTFTSNFLFQYAPEAVMCYLVYNSRNRVEAKAKITDPRVDVHSWNSLGYRFVREVWPNVKPTDEVERERVESACGGQDIAKEVQAAVYKLVGFAKNTTIEPSLQDLIDICDERNIEAPDFIEEEAGGWGTEKLAKAALKVLELSLEKDPENRICFNDQVWLPVRKNWIHGRYDLMLVDEAQDTNVVQLTMAKRALKPGGRMVVVGDDCQAIYDFRGAASDSLDNLKTELKATELGLTVTRRCCKKVVALAQALVPDYKAADDAPEGKVDSIPETSLLDWAKPGDAILSRVNAPLMTYCLRLLKRGTPARIQGRDIGAALSAAVRKLKAKSVPHFMQKLEAWANKQKAKYKNTKNYEAKCEEINDTRETLEAVADGAASVAEIESRITRLFKDDDKDTGPAVVLSSVHRAKGLEWDRVFLLRSTFNRKRPISAPPPTERQIKEEKNIYYVALTRTKQHLVFCEQVEGGRG
jgi:UvrD-like helicase C-terminal domain